MFYFFYISIFFAFLFFSLSFLDWDPLKSCIMMCLGILFMSCYISLGVHIWYSYFIILLFLSGIFSLLTYFCSMSNFIFFYNYNYFYLFSFFCLFFLFCFDYDFFSVYFDFNFLSIYYDFSYYYVFWIIFILFLLLVLVSFNFGSDCFMRGL
uniref:NADH dehydrogenase subunit 6 n=1 Tax=Loa loa TaxID=7209 RepID=G8CRC4_LOALO|nr:NADH dehydrogenase subunit 6 [Loa loa]